MRFFTFTFFILLISGSSYCQLVITPQTTAQALAQKLVGEGVTISNVTFTGSALAAGYFNNISGTHIGLDSGIVLSNGRVKTIGTTEDLRGMDGDGVTAAYTNPTSSDGGAFASSDLHKPGDADLESLLDGDVTNDATVLEFDFVPLGDTVKFRYVFSSEEYPEFACDIFNDVFGFFIQGPGFPAKTNIALVPGTTDLVTIDNINDVAGCGIYPLLYVSNKTNTQFTHNGHTRIFTALAKVQPCQVYHLKLVIADVGDGEYDSGVFLEAKSLSSNAYDIINVTPVDADGHSYLAEGCVPGRVKIVRSSATASPEVINIGYGGTAVNGVDVQLLPATVTIPANETEVFLDIIPITDGTDEGIETLTISTLAPCSAGTPTATTSLQIRDYEILQVSPGKAPDTAYICRNGSQALTATTGYTTYLWDANATLSDINSRTPVATPTSAVSKYICTATLGTCKAKDSVNIKWKDLSLVSKIDINCANGNTGQIKTEAGSSNEWPRPLEFSIDNDAYQNDSTFNNLAAGTHTIRIKDASGCIDSIAVPLVQSFPDLTSSFSKTDPSCLGGANGTIVVTAAGGKLPYTYTVDGGSFQTSNVLSAGTGPHDVIVKDANGCTKSAPVTLTFINTVTLVPGAYPTICEGKSTPLSITSNALTYEWTPSATLSSGGVFSPIASPAVTTKYYVKAITGICFQKDSVTVNVNPAPIPDAGAPVTVCYGGETTLHGTGGIEYTWSPATYLSDVHDPSPSVSHPLKSKDYLLHVKDANGCNSLIPDTAHLNVIAAVRIFAGKDTMVAINQPLQLNVVELGAAGVIHYDWLNPYHLDHSDIPDPIAVLDKDFEYYVKGLTVDHCEATDTIKVKVYKGPEIYVPTAFTPNGDGRNDILHAICIGMKELHYFRIFNRFGQIVFQTSSLNEGWNGTFRGVPQETGTYVWIAEAVSYKGPVVQRKGSVILLH